MSDYASPVPAIAALLRALTLRDQRRRAGDPELRALDRALDDYVAALGATIAIRTQVRR
jgi:hypothetical protein